VKDELVYERIEEDVIPDKRLGRHIHHDPRSAAFNVTQLVARVEEFREVHHHRHTGPFNQGDLGSCTGNAAAGACDTDPVYGVKLHHRIYEPTAVKLYSLATQLDAYDGSYPPQDTGSDGLSVAKACVKKGFISSYLHAFTLEDALTALQTTPWIFGSNWYSSMDEPDDHGIVTVGGSVRGGHEYEALEYIPQGTGTYLDDLVGFINSWGRSWGEEGRFYMTVRDFGRLQDEQGDVTVLVA
jgi:hypothetical protein